jgi:hypothetical protein
MNSCRETLPFLSWSISNKSCFTWASAVPPGGAAATGAEYGAMTPTAAMKTTTSLNMTIPPVRV